MAGHDAELIGAIAAYLVDAARQEASVRLVLPVLHHYKGQGASKHGLLRAAAQARQERPTWTLLHDYETAIQQHL